LLQTGKENYRTLTTETSTSKKGAERMKKTMNHPLKVFFEKNELTPRAFAVLNDISLDTVRGFMSGKSRRIPTGIKEALVNYPVDVNEIEKQYTQWLQLKAIEDIEKLRQKKGVK
jgi:DNA-binding transcriptional regulator YiaG